MTKYQTMETSSIKEVYTINGDYWKDNDFTFDFDDDEELLAVWNKNPKYPSFLIPYGQILKAVIATPVDE